ncbi:MAG: hypothetical protein VKJ85_14905 [Prochlorothrix sp.]|nr:hypothetical protein [Prochlorothrix sp.]
MTENYEDRPVVEVEVDPEASMNLLQSLEYASNQLQNLRERMENSDRELYRTVGEFVDSSHQTIQNLAAEALDFPSDDFLIPAAIEPPQGELQQLQNRHHTLMEEIHSLLLVAYSNEEIDRLRHLYYLTDRISSRIQRLSKVQPKKVSVDELKSQFSSLKKAKDFHNLKAKSWQDLAEKLNNIP